MMMARAARLAVGHVGHRPIAEITKQSVSFIIVPSFTSKHEDASPREMDQVNDLAVELEQ